MNFHSQMKIKNVQKKSYRKYFPFTDKRLVLAQNSMYNIPCKKNEEMMKELTRILSLPPRKLAVCQFWRACLSKGGGES